MPDASNFFIQEVQVKKNKNRNMHNSEFKQINFNAAGVDIGAESHYVAVPEG